MSSAMTTIQPTDIGALRRWRRPYMHMTPPTNPNAKLSEFAVEFGIRLGGETGVIVAKGSMDCHFRVTAKWTHQ